MGGHVTGWPDGIDTVGVKSSTVNTGLKIIKNERGFITGFEGEATIFENPTAFALMAKEHNAHLALEKEYGPELARGEARDMFPTEEGEVMSFRHTMTIFDPELEALLTKEYGPEMDIEEEDY